MEDRNNPGYMLGEPVGLQGVMYESYKDDPYFRLLVDLLPVGEEYIYDNSWDGVSAEQLAKGIKCTVDVANGILMSLLASKKIYGFGDDVLLYRHKGWDDGSEAYCPVCGSPSHSDCGS